MPASCPSSATKVSPTPRAPTATFRWSCAAAAHDVATVPTAASSSAHILEPVMLILPVIARRRAIECFPIRVNKSIGGAIRGALLRAQPERAHELTGLFHFLRQQRA